MKLKCILFLTITIIVLMKFAGSSSSDCPKTHTKIRLASKIKFIISITNLINWKENNVVGLYRSLCKPIKIDKNVFLKNY